MKRCGEWTAVSARVGAAAVTASGYTEGGRGSAMPPASANHACYWAGFGEAAANDSQTFLFPMKPHSIPVAPLKSFKGKVWTSYYLGNHLI